MNEAAETAPLLCSRYGFQAVYFNLVWKVKQLSRMPRPTHTQFLERPGQLIQKESGEMSESWIVISDRRTKVPVAGFFNGPAEGGLRTGWYSCEIDPEILASHARDVLENNEWTKMLIVAVEVQNQDVLFMQIEDEGELQWFPVGILEYGLPPKGRRYPLRWMRVAPITPGLLVELQGFKPKSSASNIAGMTSVLRRISGWKGNIKDVQCLLTLNVKEGVYRVDLLESGKAIARRETSDTREVISFLRTPFRTGEYIRTKDGSYLKWDHTTDVEYDDVKIEAPDGKKEWIDLSFLKPHIHRSSFLDGSFPLPDSSYTILQTRMAGDTVLTVQVDERLRNAGVSKHLRVILADVQDDSMLKSIESEAMSIYDVALLAECKQLIDTDSNLRYDVELDVESLLSLRISQDLSEYGRLHNAIMGLIESKQDAEFEEPEVTIEPSGPPLRLVKVTTETGARDTVIEVHAIMADVEDDNDTQDVVIFSMPRAVIKSQAVSLEHFGNEIKYNIGGYQISDEVEEELNEAAQTALTKRGVRFSDD